MSNSNHLLTVEQMGTADRMTIAGGTPGIVLMERAGAGMARVIRRRYSVRSVLAACGPGNNGGDGFITARILRDAGWPVRLALLGDVENLKGDAAIAAERWGDAIAPLSAQSLDGCALLVDAIFGAGLSKPLSGAVLDFAEAARNKVLSDDLVSVAADMPSGVDGDTGEVKGAAIPAAETVTFFRRKPGHLLMPGRDLAGRVHVVDIGIDPGVLDKIGPKQFANHPANWRNNLPSVVPTGHKYKRGHTLIYGGPEMTGAARLAAAAARRLGSGLVSITAPQSSFAVYAADSAGTIILPSDDVASFQSHLSDTRKNCILVGPGAGVNQQTRDIAVKSLETERPVVLDADAISCFAGRLSELSRAISGPVVLTPHDGEFARLFGDLTRDCTGKSDKALKAAEATGAVIVFKGPDTVIAEPNGEVWINENAPPTLASGGTGDVLAGMIAGLMAQGMEAGHSAAAAVWLHGAAGRACGDHLIAEDLPVEAAAVLHHIRRGGGSAPTHGYMPLITEQ